MRGVAELLRAAFSGLTREDDPDEELEPLDELPSLARDALINGQWITNRPRLPREQPLMVANIRNDPRSSVGDVTRVSALGTLLEGAMSFALDDAVDGNCDWIDIRLLGDGSAVVTHGGPGYTPERAAKAMQRWPWLRRSPEGEVVLTQSLAAPIVTCALSHWCRLEIRRAEGTYRQAFYKGQPECPLSKSPPDRVQDTHTRVHFRPDPQMFGSLGFCVDDLYMRGLGFSVELEGIELRIHDERTVAAPLIMVGSG